MKNPFLNTSLPSQVLIALLLGIIFGLLVGDFASILEPIGQIYTMLMEVVVFPYLICTLLISLGGLTPSLSVKLFKRGGVIYLFLLFLTFATLIILSRALPIRPTSGKVMEGINRIILLY